MKNIKKLELHKIEARKSRSYTSELEIDLTPEGHTEVENFEEAQNGLEASTPPKNSFKYKASHQEELIIGNKYGPFRTRITFKNENSMIGFISLIMPTSVDEALSDDRCIVAT